MENELPKVVTAPKEEVVVAKNESSKKTELLAKVRTFKMSKKNKTFAAGLIVLALIAGGLYYYKGVFIVATVNGSPISRLSVVKELEKKAGKNILDTMITKKLISDEVKKAGIVVKNEDIDAEMKKIEDQVTSQGGTLETALAGQGMTVGELREQIVINKELEQILADKITVSDDEINQYLSTNKTVTPKGTSSDDMKAQVREQLKGQKFNTEAEKWVSDLKANAQINYFIQY